MLQVAGLWAYFGLIVTILVIVLAFCLTEFALAINYIKAKKNGYGQEVRPSLTHFPKVTIQLPVYNEMYVAERVIRSAADINYPKEHLQILVLDDSTDETAAISRKVVEELQATGLNIEWIHRKDRKGYKAGALRDSMKEVCGEYIAIFDADFLLPKNFLLDTLPQFIDENVGMVQTRWGHLNEKFSLLTRIQSFFIDLHFSVQHTGRNAFGYFINFNGTAGIWRRTCIEDAGGWTPDTLTEDLDLSYRAQIKGWKFIYQEGTASPAELPALMSGIKSQQFRWIKGGTQVGKKMFFPLAKSNATKKQKWFGFMHLFSGSAYIFSFALFLLSVPLVYLLKNTDLQDYIPYLSVFMLSTIAILFAGGVSFFHVQDEHMHYKMPTFLWRFSMFLCFTMGLSFNNAIAVLEGFTGKTSAFIRTPKFNISDGSGELQLSNAAYLSRGFQPQIIFEFLLLLYFLLGIILAIYFQFYGLLLLHLMLVTGYALVVFYSVKHSLLLR